jgi:hypothetical protein
MTLMDRTELRHLRIENAELRESVDRLLALVANVRERITGLTLAAGLPREVWSELCRIDSDLVIARIKADE